MPLLENGDGKLHMVLASVDLELSSLIIFD